MKKEKTKDRAEVDLPKKIRRISDGEIFSKNFDGTYSMDKQKIEMPTTFYHWSYSMLNTSEFEPVKEIIEEIDNHCSIVKLVDIDTTEEGIGNSDALGGPTSPIRNWRRYRIEYGGCNEDTLIEGTIYLPPRADPKSIVNLMMGMQVDEQVWEDIVDDDEAI